MLRATCDIWPDSLLVNALDIASMHMVLSTDGGHGDATICVLVDGATGETYRCRAQTAMQIWRRLREGWKINRALHWQATCGLPIGEEMLSIYRRYKEQSCERSCERPSTSPPAPSPR